MITKESHPFVWNTLESDPRWALTINYWHGWEVSLVWGAPDDDNDTFAMARDLPEALDKLESLLSGKEGAGFNLYDTPDVWTSQPEPVAVPEWAVRLLGRKARPVATADDAEHAAYLARWEDAPEWAQWLSQDHNGRCDWWEVRPALHENQVWFKADREPFHFRETSCNLLGSIRCEPRPEVQP